MQFGVPFSSCRQDCRYALACTKTNRQVRSVLVPFPFSSAAPRPQPVSFQLAMLWARACIGSSRERSRNPEPWRCSVVGGADGADACSSRANIVAVRLLNSLAHVAGGLIAERRDGQSRRRGSDGWGFEHLFLYRSSARSGCGRHHSGDARRIDVNGGTVPRESRRLIRADVAGSSGRRRSTGGIRKRYGASARRESPGGRRRRGRGRRCFSRIPNCGAAAFHGAISCNTISGNATSARSGDRRGAASGPPSGKHFDGRPGGRQYRKRRR